MKKDFNDCLDIVGSLILRGITKSDTVLILDGLFWEFSMKKLKYHTDSDNNSLSFLAELSTLLVNMDDARQVKLLDTLTTYCSTKQKLSVSVLTMKEAAAYANDFCGAFRIACEVVDGTREATPGARKLLVLYLLNFQSENYKTPENSKQYPNDTIKVVLNSLE